MTVPILLAEHIDGGWRPGIGDPTVAGWTIVAAYFAAAIACWRAASAECRIGTDGRVAHPVFWRPGFGSVRETAYGDRRQAASAGRRAAFWRILAAGMVLLGVNKQLDLQSLIPIIGRRVAREQGWYEGREVVQRAFIAAVAVAGSGALAALCLRFRSVVARRPLAPLGMAFLLVFILVRASSFHKVDALLGLEAMGTSVNRLLELGGIACVLASALLCVWDERNENAAVK